MHSLATATLQRTFEGWLMSFLAVSYEASVDLSVPASSRRILEYNLLLFDQLFLSNSEYQLVTSENSYVHPT